MTLALSHGRKIPVQTVTLFSSWKLVETVLCPPSQLQTLPQPPPISSHCPISFLLFPAMFLKRVDSLHCPLLAHLTPQLLAWWSPVSSPQRHYPVPTTSMLNLTDPSHPIPRLSRPPRISRQISSCLLLKPLAPSRGALLVSSDCTLLSSFTGFSSFAFP